MYVMTEIDTFYFSPFINKYPKEYIGFGYDYVTPRNTNRGMKRRVYIDYYKVNM